MHDGVALHAVRHLLIWLPLSQASRNNLLEVFLSGAKTSRASFFMIVVLKAVFKPDWIAVAFMVNFSATGAIINMLFTSSEDLSTLGEILQVVKRCTSAFAKLVLVTVAPVMVLGMMV